MPAVPLRSPVLSAVSPATLEMLTMDEPPFSLAPSLAAAAFRRGCSNWEGGLHGGVGGEGTTAKRARMHVLGTAL